MNRTDAKARLVAGLLPRLRGVMAAEPVRWIGAFVKIEDVDTGLPVPFTLWPKQVGALQAFISSRLVVALKARQLGFTWLALAYAVWRMLSRPGFKVVALSKGEDEAKELVRRLFFILRHLPAPFAVAGKGSGDVPGYEGSTERITIHHPGREDSTFQALPAAPNAGRMFTASLVIIDEWAFQQWAAEIWTAAYPTINRPEGSGQVIGLSTGKRGTFFERVWNEAVAGTNGITPIFLNWRADPRRSDAWYEETRRALPTTYRQEYPTNPQDAFAAGAGAAFPEWDEEVHATHEPLWYPPETWRIIRSYDSGYMTRACCKWYALDHDGAAICYREYYPTQVVDAEQAEEIARLSVRRDGSPEEIAYTVGDPACWQKKSATGISTAEVFSRHGVHMRPADNDRVNGWRRLHEWLRVIVGADGEEMARLRFTQSCANTLRTYPALTMDKNRPEDVDTDLEDHCQDCDRYFVMSRPAPSLTEEAAKTRARARRRRVRPVISEITGY